MSHNNVLPFPGGHRRSPRHRRGRKRRFPLRLLALATTCLVIAWTHPASLDGRLSPETADKVVRVLRGGDAWNGGPRAGTLSGPVTRVRDGDTIVVSDTPVRIANLDCAETGTAAGDAATARLRQILGRGSQVSCRLSGHKTYDRVVGLCKDASGRDLGARMIAEKYCRRWQ